MPDFGGLLVDGDLRAAREELRHLANAKEQEWIMFDSKGSDLIGPMALGEMQAYLKLGYELGLALREVAHA